MDDDIKNTIICGDNAGVLAGFEAGSSDTVITDPPYGWEFMGKRWDYEVPSVETWQAILRVLKPGGTLLCFAGSRTQHRMAVNVEDAGFILKDCIMWIYGSGFPKATDISKAIDKVKGAVREVIKKGNEVKRMIPGADQHRTGSWIKDNGRTYQPSTEIPATAEGLLWDGWKSHGLKPAYEPIIVAMKPNDGSYANNALTHGVAGLNIDASRIALDGEKIPTGGGGKVIDSATDQRWGFVGNGGNETSDKGRYPANVIFDEQAAAMLDDQSGELASGSREGEYDVGSFTSKGSVSRQLRPSVGGASRFFYCAKASKSERNEGCQQLAEGQTIGGGGTNNTPDDVCGKYGSIKAAGRNHHPTVKPLDLMRYLCRLTSTPTGGCILDPFAGSGTTLVAAYLTGRTFIGIEWDTEYVKIAEARVAAAKEKFSLFEQSQG